MESSCDTGSALALVVIRDELVSRRVWGRRMLNYRTRQVVVLGPDRGALMQWVVANYGSQVNSSAEVV